MGLLNTNQILSGARTLAGDKTYAQCLIKQRPTYTIGADADADTITFTNGIVEVEGRDYAITNSALDFSALGSAVAVGQSFIVGLVPKYAEPADRTAAETANLDYYISNDANTGEAVAHQFLPSDVEQAVLNKGGIIALSKRVYQGNATPEDITVFNAYYEAEQRGWDPRYIIQPLAPIGFDFVLAEVIATDNSPKTNALYGMSLADFNLIKSQLALIPSVRYVHTVAEANARYFTANKKHVLQSAKTYTSQTNAINDVSGTVVNLTSATTFTGGGATHVAVYEYEYPSKLPLGQIGRPESVIRYVSKKEAALLGRIDPIFMATNPFTLRFANQTPASRLTHYGDPEPLVKLTLGASLAVTSVTPFFAN